MTSQGNQPIGDASPEERMVWLNSAVENGNWGLVIDILFNGEVDIYDETHSSLLQKMASAKGVRSVLVKEIVKKFISPVKVTQELKSIGRNIVLEADTADSWDTFIDFLSATGSSLINNITLVTIVQSMVASQTLRTKPYLHMDVFAALWRNSKQTILNCEEQSIHNTLVQLAAELSMWSRVCDLLEVKPDLNVLDRDGLSVLHRLVMCPDSRFDSLFPVLLEHGADIRFRNSKGETALHLAAKHQKIVYVSYYSDPKKINDKTQCKKIQVMNEYRRKRINSKLQALEQFIQSCDNLDDRDEDGNTALIVAVKNNWKFMELLFQHGALADIPDGCQRSVLHVLAFKRPAMIFSMRDVAEWCVHYGAQVNRTDRDGCSPLHLAVQSGDWNFFHTLISLGAQPELSDAAGYNVLHRLAMTTSDQLENTFPLFFDDLIHKGISLNHRILTDDSALQLAAKHENWPVFKYLLELGAQVDEADSEGITVMQRFVQSRLEPSETQSIFQILLDHSAVTNTRNSRGDSVLQLAAKHEKWSVVEHMVKHLVENAEENDSEGFRIIDRAVLTLKHALSKWFSPSYCTYSLELIKKATNCELSSLVHMAARSQTDDVLNVVLDVFENVNVTDDEGFTPLHRVAQNRAENPSGLISRLVQKGALVDMRCCNGNTPMQLAAKSNNWRAVQELLQYRASVSGVDNEGNSVLHRLIGQTHLLCEQCKQGTAAKKLVFLLTDLLSKGALIDEKDHHGNTPLHLAVRHEQWDMAIELLARGASLTERDSEGCTILHLLAKRNNSVNVELSSCQFESSHEGSTSQPNEVDSHVDTRMPSINNCGTCNLDNNKELTCLFLCSSLAKQNFTHLDMCDLFVDHTYLVDARDCHGNTAFLLSAKHNNWDITQRLLLKGADTSLLNLEGFTLVHMLTSVNPVCVDGIWTENMQIAILNHLISQNADVTARDPEGNTPIQLAARHGNMDMVSEMLRFKVNVNETDREGFTLLSRVAQTPSPKSEDIARSLLEKGADVNIACPDGKTPLMLSVLSRNWPVASLLLQKSDVVPQHLLQESLFIQFIEDISTKEDDLYEYQNLTRWILKTVENTENQRNSDGRSGIQLAITKRLWNIVRILGYYGHHTDPEPLLGEMAFHGFAQCVLREDQGSFLSTMMPSTKLNMDLRDENGDTPLNIFARCGSWKFVKLLLDHGADVSLADSVGLTVLHQLVMTVKWHEKDTELSDLLSRLVERGSDINMADPNGKTPVMMALEEKRWPVFWRLLQLGARFDWANCDKRLILHNIYHMPRKHIQEEKLMQIVKRLTETRPGLTFVETADCVCCAQRGFERCVMRSRWTAAKVLLQSKPEIDITRLVNGDSHVLHKMVSLHEDHDHDTWMSLLNTLLARGLDINCRNYSGKTVLMEQKVLSSLINSRMSTGDLFTTLLAKGCSPLLVDDRGNTVLTHALDFYGKDALTIVISLVKLGVIFHLPQIDNVIANGDYREPITEAARKKNISVLKILIECGVCSNSQLFSLSAEFETRWSVEAQSDIRGQNIRQILQKAATQPRSLASLCRLAVSRAVPYSPNRTDMISSLPIASALKDYLMFTDVKDAVKEGIEDSMTRLRVWNYFPDAYSQHDSHFLNGWE